MSDDKTMMVKMAFLYVQSGEWYKAIEEYKKLLALDPEDAHVLNMMGDAYAKKKDDSDAFTAYQKAKILYEKLDQPNKITQIDRKIAKLSSDKMDPGQKKLHLSICKSQEAEVMAAEGRLDDAIARYLELIEAEPINFSYRDKLAHLYLENAMVTEAAAQLKAIADIHLEEGRVELAQKYATKIASVDPEGMETLQLMANLSQKKGDSGEVSQNYAKLAQSAFDAGRYEEAKSALDTSIQAGHQELKPLYAKTLLALKRPAEARPILEELLSASPNDDALLEQLLSLCEETKDWPSAHQHIQTLLTVRTNDPKLQPRLARVLIQVNRRPEAVQIYQSLAAAALAESKPEVAFSYFDSILALEPDNLDVLKKKAEMYLKMGKKQEVIDAYKRIQAVYLQKNMADEAKKVGVILTRLAGLKG
jgi:tetratricopeptide (TPR) repeat protein